MKRLSYVLAALLVILAACEKNASGISSSFAPTHMNGSRWLLVQEQNSIPGPGTRTITPSVDSAVTLEFNDSVTYTTALNKRLVSQGSYAITNDTTAAGRYSLQLNNFTTTGIFNLFILIEVGNNGQVLQQSDNFFMKLSNDTLYLTTPITPGGNLSYTFVKL